ncbi:PocR ligand-binding domain-containing protein [Clostridium sardiniense]|uniref:PocR ligand-binding domain-containing protein n=1 Tax=Clostridium sardiniense TaxID=29369 RepID=UPI003D33FAE6
MCSIKKLKNLIDIDLLESIQNRLAEITGLAFNIVDFRGEPMNEYSNFCDFCKEMRSTEEGMKLCYEANAHAGLEAAIRQKPYVFKCPAGLVDVATPIIINNHYIGAIFFGQVRTNNDEIDTIKESRDCMKLIKKNDKLKKYYDETKFIDYKKIESIHSLVSIFINQLVEKSELELIKEEANFNNIKLHREIEENKKLKNELIISNLKLLQTPINLNFELNILNSISNLAVIEDAPRVKEMSHYLADLTRYSSKNIGCEVTLEEDIENIITYLKVQSIRFGNRIKYNINIDENIKDIKILPMVLLSFIEYSITKGLAPKIEGGTISINGEVLENNAIITIEDNGIGISENELFHILNGIYNEKTIGANIYGINDMLVNCYGEKYRVQIASRDNIGTIIRIKFPLNK